MPLLKPPEKLRPFLFHGLELNWERGEEECLCDCLFCGRENKFSVNRETGLFKCWRCKESGNVYVFLRKFHAQAMEGNQSLEAAYSSLRDERKLLYNDTFRAWQIVTSPTSSEWMLPGWGPDGALNGLYLYRWNNEEKRHFWKPTPTLKHHLFGMNLWSKKKKTVYLLEGIWDALAFYEIAAQTDVLEEANVLAIPTASVWYDKWLPLFANRIVMLLPQNDHPLERNGKTIEPASQEWFKRIAHSLSKSEKPPTEIHWLPWGENDWYDSDLPSGYDIRDELTHA